MDMNVDKQNEVIYASCLYQYSKSMSMLHVLVHAACPCPGCILCPCCMFMSILNMDKGTDKDRKLDMDIFTGTDMIMDKDMH
jgi:hypothetical protein